MTTPSACVLHCAEWCDPGWGWASVQHSISSGMEVWENCPNICNYLFYLFLFNKHINNSSSCHHILKHMLQIMKP